MLINKPDIIQVSNETYPYILLADYHNISLYITNEAFDKSESKNDSESVIYRYIYNNKGPHRLKDHWFSYCLFKCSPLGNMNKQCTLDWGI